jgi:hypothetical protein
MAAGRARVAAEWALLILMLAAIAILQAARFWDGQIHEAPRWPPAWWP